MSQGSPPQDTTEPSPESDSRKEQTTATTTTTAVTAAVDAGAPPAPTRSRPSRACTIRAAARLLSASQPARPKAARREPRREGSPSSPPPPPQLQQCSKIVTPLVEPPPAAQLPRYNLRSMWELASILNFLNLFRPLLNISVEFSAEEFETALLTPNDTLGDIHVPLLKAIPPITRMALSRDTWITVLCRKLRDWWQWVADGDLPIVASHGMEVEVYKSLDPGVRVVILKALCDIRVEQEDIRGYIDRSIKHGIPLSTFRKERIGGDSHGISYWYEDDQIIGHRLYREIRKTEVVQMKKGKPRGSQVFSNTTYQWETVATNFDEFQDVSEKLFTSKNRMEASVGKKVKIDMLPEIEKVHKRKEKLLKKQHRQALLLDNFLGVDGIAPGRSLRDRKPVTYTFDDYDRSINEAIKITKRKPPSPELIPRREAGAKPEALTNGKWSGPSHDPQDLNFGMPSPKSPDSDDMEEENQTDMLDLDRSNRRRQKPKRYSEKDFVEALSDNEADYDSDDDIVGEAVYDEEYLQKRKQRRKASSSSGSEGDEEYHWDEDHVEDEEDSLSVSEDSDKPRKFKRLAGRTRRETKVRSVGEIQSGLRRSKRAKTKSRINYRRYEISDSETEFIKSDKSNASDDHSDPTENGEYMMESEDSDGNDEEEQETKAVEPVTYPAEENNQSPAVEENEQNQNLPPEKSSSPGQEEVEGTAKRRFLDLNELAPSSGFDDGPNTTTLKDEGGNDDN
ncbi:DDT domain-containing protein DDR4 [Glycine soja]|uniref:DDT domain-containing protein DDR4 isoform A n=1 Tax=Glycine soja TaxID=3848 RepID=A0A445KBT0_GLYSO|nr:DDT domain-containing protein DDR4-like [Glycine soja]RZC08245.1 DDT domain-containing protein DDR4 isoform A [Glycine soja]